MSTTAVKFEPVVEDKPVEPVKDKPEKFYSFKARRTRNNPKLSYRALFLIILLSALVSLFLGLTIMTSTNMIKSQHHAYFIFRYFGRQLANDQPKITSTTTPASDVNSIKLILLYEDSNIEPFINPPPGSAAFEDRNCSYQNCILDSKYESTNYDAIVFFSSGINKVPRALLPHSEHQINEKRIFVTNQPRNLFSICDVNYNDYFNLIWTYRLDSDAVLAHIAVKDKNGNVVGPKLNTHWLKQEAMKPVSDELKQKLRHKTKAAAWLATNCRNNTYIYKYVKSLQKALQFYNLTIDIYGDCEFATHNKTDDWYNLLEKDYFFYLAFEQVIEDYYVTETLLIPLQHNVVPIVLGGANYTQFMPEGMYLDVKNYSHRSLAKKMYDLINNTEKYYNYFKWQNHYTFHSTNDPSTPDINNYCKLCELVNGNTSNDKSSKHTNFVKWWNPHVKLC